jgi:predicted permease
MDQLRQVFRRLSRAPLFTAVSLITLAVGVGATTLIFSVVEGVLLKPLPYPRADQLIGVGLTAPGVGVKDLNIAPSVYFIDREQSTTLQDIGAYDGDSLSVTGVGEPEHVSGLNMTDGTLSILGVVPALGRIFTREDDSPGRPETVLLSYGYWRRRFGGAASVIGRSIIVDGKPRQIIGVLPQNFQFLDNPDDPALFLPFQLDRNKTMLGNFSYRALARMKPGVTLAQANVDMARLLPVVLRSFPAPQGMSAKVFENARMAPTLRPLKQDVIGDVGNVLWVLMGSIVMVLLIACANVANLLLVRVEGRRQELTIRAALGAGRGRVAADLLLESVVLGVLGSALGLTFAYGGLRLLLAMAPASLPRIREIGIDVPVLLFTLALALFSGLLIGSIPVLKYASARLNTSLREGGRALSESRERHRARNTLVILQVALALVLLICSGLMIRTFRALMHVPPGFAAADTIQTFRLFVPETQVPDSEGERLVRMQQAMLNKVAAIPVVSAVSLSTAIPMDGNGRFDPVMSQDREYKEGELPPLRRFKFISPGFFATLGAPLIAGRDLTWTDIYTKTPVAIISENFAREYWRSASGALGQRIRVSNGDDWREIIGVAGDIHDDGVNKPAPTTVYWPILMGNFEGQKESVRRNIALAIRSPRAGSEAFMKDIQQAVWSLDPNLPLADVNTLGHYYTKSMARTSFTLVMLGVAGSMALLLGIVGIHGVISYSVLQRTREIGIRMALGAQRQTITAMFLRDGLWLTGIGAACGLLAALAAMHLMSSLLFNVSPVDPVTYATITAGVFAAACLASYLPSRRAATVEPLSALRAE